MLTNTSTSSKKMTTKSIVLCGMFAAVLAVISQISLPMPGGVPITIQVFGVALAGTVLGWRLGLLSTIAYILLGAVGLPVFSSFRGGIQVLTGMAGGYVLAWPIMAVLCGITIKHMGKRTGLICSLLLGLLGLLIVETAGAIQWAYLASDKTMGAILIYSLTAFVPKDIILTVAGILVGRQIRDRIH